MNTYEGDVRAFAAQFPTPNTIRLVRLCEEGRIAWIDAYSLARRAVAEGLAVVREG